MLYLSEMISPAPLLFNLRVRYQWHPSGYTTVCNMKHVLYVFFSRDDLSKTIAGCAKAMVGTYQYFAIKFYGECMAGDSTTPDTYFLEGESKDCLDGTGAAYSVYVYHFLPAGKSNQFLQSLRNI